MPDMSVDFVELNPVLFMSLFTRTVEEAELDVFCA